MCLKMGIKTTCTKSLTVTHDQDSILCLGLLFFREWPFEEKNMRLRVVDHIMNPSSALLHSNPAPFFLCHKVGGGNFAKHVLR